MPTHHYQQFLESFISFEKTARIKDFSLKPIYTKLLDKNYAHGFKNILYYHVAGSKGKGSTSKMLSIYLSSIAKTGLYTSPHIYKINERIAVQNQEITDQQLQNLSDQLQNHYLKTTKKDQISYFDILTAMALQHFCNQKCQYAVMEVGIGGRLDSTNVINAQACIITKIEKEHTDILGHNIKNIIDEQLGIVKNQEHLFIGHQTPSIEKILRHKLQNRPNTYFLTDHPQPFCQQLPYQNLVQKENAALAALTLQKTLKTFDQQTFLTLLQNFQNPGRFQIKKIQDKTVIFDMAHTPSSIDNLLKSLTKKYGTDQNYTFLISIMKDKQIPDITNLINQFQKPLDQIHLTESHPIRSLSTSALQKFLPNSQTHQNCHQAFQSLLNQPSKNPIIVTGSHFLVSELLN